ncbi:Calcium/proton exchanger [Ephemerocybe angulata]|uniref:Calcium/proton exchanger n=1 Tax=Ephemerocybe angulata TaxID=980116 RepID=A0A8H6M673_9AGAR|nr:Calcium/proton exchanger [Tulosesus angulatus]
MSEYHVSHSQESTAVGHQDGAAPTLVASPLQSPQPYIPEERLDASTSTAHSTAINRSQSQRSTAQPRRGTGSKPHQKARTLSQLVTPEKRLGKEPTLVESLRALMFGSWFNVLLVFIPVSWALNFALPHSNPHKDLVVFITSFIAIIPLAKLLGFATEELSLRVGQTLAGLLNATLGNVVELIVAIIALVKCELRVVQASLVGSILSNLLLVLGMCFFAGGMKFSEQGFGLSATQLNSSLLTVSVIAVLLPAAFHFSVPNLADSVEAMDILAVSHGTAIILLVIYVAYLIFQLFSHANLYEDTGDHIFKSTDYGDKTKDTMHKILRRPASPKEKVRDAEGADHASVDEEEEEVETPSMTLLVSIAALVVVTALVAVTAEWLVDSIDGLTSTGKISKEFVGIILLPIVGNAAEHLTAVTVSVKDKLTLSIGVAVGSSIQIALFVIPLVVTIAWIMGKPLSLLFDPYESIALFLAVLTVNYVVQDGKSNWLEGFILICLYLILAVTFWFYPGSSELGC